MRETVRSAPNSRPPINPVGFSLTHFSPGSSYAPEAGLRPGQFASRRDGNPRKGLQQGGEGDRPTPGPKSVLSIAGAIGIEGLVEIELILAGDEIFFLEVNPRLSATMRMTSLACNRSIFAEVALPQLVPGWPGESPRPVCFTAELPIPPGAEPGALAQIGFPLWISSRITTAAPDPDTLARQLYELASRLQLTGLLAES
jgi:hypothetical protein